MQKTAQTPEQIVEAINSALTKSTELDGDCRNCQVRRICRVSAEELRTLNRNWNVDVVNGRCKGECMSVLKDIAKNLGLKFDAVWN